MPTTAETKPCSIRANVVRMIEQARADAAGPDRPETALRLAAETIRLARLAASTHMVLEARRIHSEAAETGGRP